MPIRVGLKDVVYALLLTDPAGGAPTWDTPVSLPCAVTASQKAVGAIDKFYGNDAICDVNEILAGIDLDLQISNLTLQHMAALLGHTYANGGLTKKAGDTSPWVAIGFKVKQTDGNYRYTWILKCKAKKPDENAETLKESTTFQSYALTMTCIPLESTRELSFQMDESDPLLDATTFANFFTNVTTASSDTTALTATAAEGAGGDAGKVVITFSKASAASFSLNTSSVVLANSIMIVDTTGNRAGTLAISGAGTTVTVKFTPTVAFSAEEIGVVWTSGVKDNSNVSATPNGDVLTFV